MLGWPGGASLSMLVGAIVVGAGGYAMYQAYTSKFLKRCRSIDSPNITQIEITDEFAPPTHFEAD